MDEIAGYHLAEAVGALVDLDPLDTDPFTRSGSGR